MALPGLSDRIPALRIMMMISSLAVSGGAEMLVRNLAAEYARRGHRCHIVYISDAAGLNASADYERGFKVAMDAAGVGYTELGHACRRNPLLGGWRLRRAVRRFRPDIIHMHLGYGLLFQAVGLIRSPTIYTNHNTIFRFSPKLFPIFDRFVDQYVAICRACEVLLAKHVTKPITLIYNGVPADFSNAEIRQRPSEDINILSVGDLTPQKDYPTLIDAAARLVTLFRAQARRITFSIAGSGSERHALEALLRDRGLEGDVHLLGTRRDVAALMAKADLLVLASRYEGLPITLIEAAMSALPAVATDVGGSGEVVEDGQTGLLVPVGSSKAIAEAVVALLSDAKHYAACSAAAKARSRQFTLDSCAAAHLALYKAVVTGR